MKTKYMLSLILLASSVLLVSCDGDDDDEDGDQLDYSVNLEGNWSVQSTNVQDTCNGGEGTVTNDVVQIIQEDNIVSISGLDFIDPSSKGAVKGQTIEIFSEFSSDRPADGGLGQMMNSVTLSLQPNGTLIGEISWQWNLNGGTAANSCTGGFDLVATCQDASGCVEEVVEDLDGD